MAGNERYVTYFRVSTRAQGKSGLGIDAQKEAVAGYLRERRGQVFAEFTEIESGKRSDRPELERALAAARVHKAALVVAKVDRLTRSVGFLSRLLETGVDVRFADLPAIEGPTGRFMLQQMAAVAELEAGMISARTKAALAATKARGQRLGGYRGYVISDDAKRAGRRSQAGKAHRRAIDLRDILEALRAEGNQTHRQLAEALDAKGVPTARGGHRWSATQVARIEARLRAALHYPG
jgi:DNA invertase Pin-like site-specific DNA recombinase